MTYKQRNAFWLSLFAHVVLLVFILVKAQFTSLPHSIPQHESIHVNSVLITLPTPPSMTMQPDDLTHKNIAKPQITKPFIKKQLTNVQTKNNDDGLLAILHQAISTQQIYPAMALELNQAGKVTIGFYLYPDGRLEQITLLTSSGFPILDDAALAAVAKISPLSQAHAYLQAKKYYSVTVVFE